MIPRTLVSMLVAVILFAASAAAQDASRAGWMSDDAIRGEFTGHLLNGIYPSGSPWSEHLFGDGATDYREGAKRWRGQWWIESRAFCFAYPEPGTGGCFRVVRLGQNCYELYEATGLAGRGDDAPVGASLWNGRMWRADRPATCDEKPTS